MSPRQHQNVASQFLHRSMQLFHKDRWIKITIYFCWIFNGVGFVIAVAVYCRRLKMKLKKKNSKTNTTLSHIHFMFVWMIFIAALFVMLLLLLLFQLNSNLLLKSQHFVHTLDICYGTEHWMYWGWRRLLLLLQCDGKTTHWQRKGGLTYHSKSNRLFWIIDKLSLYVLDLISPGISWIAHDIPIVSVSVYMCANECVLRGFWFQAGSTTNPLIL